MQDLRLVGIHEDGVSLLLAGPDGDRLRLPIDDALRAAIRRDRPRGDGSVEGSAPEPMRPREVQALMRSGANIDEVAERSGWTVEKVRRFEPPIRAERDYVAGLARAVTVPGHASAGDGTLGERVQHRLKERGVETERVSWDAWKDDDGRWSVVCIFPAGGRERRAAWTFVPDDRALSARDDEARWLGEDATTTRPKPAVTTGRRAAGVYDVESDGGVAAVRRRSAAARDTSATPEAAEPSSDASADRRPEHVDGEHPSGTHGSDHGAPEAAHDEAVDLVSAMRERVAARKRTSRKRTARPTDTPIAPDEMPEQARPVERLRMADAPEPPPGDRSGGALSADGQDDEPSAGPDELGHDPVTGTVDLFADLEAVAYGSDDTPGDDTTTDTGVDDDDAAVGDEAQEAEEAAAGDEADEADAADIDDDAAEVTAADAAATAPDDETGDDDHASEPAASAAATQVPTRQSSSRKGRPSVPSWDDIMFGTRGTDPS